MMIRSFLPVGQGAFYCEQFGGFAETERVNIIYDCGSSTNVKLVEEQIKNNFQKNSPQSWGGWLVYFMVLIGVNFIQIRGF